MSSPTRSRSADIAPRAPGAARAPRDSVASALRGALHTALGRDIPVRFEFWDGSATGDPSAGRVRLHGPMAIRRILWAPDQLGVARAYVAGDLDIDGDVYAVLKALRDAAPTDLRFGVGMAAAVLRGAFEIGAVGPPPPPPAEEIRPQGLLHSRSRDARAISHHYDVGNEYYRLMLGPSMTYSCARFVSDDMSLAEAQAAKHELICRKLGLHERPGQRLLDVGCGWGSLALHAARHHGATVVGVTISREQVDLARQRVAEAGLTGRVEIRLQDYRDVRDETFDAIASVGMSEHVGHRRARTYFDTLHALLVPQGRLLNHAISSAGGSRLGRRSFAGRYVFPDGELMDVGQQALVMERSGFEIRDVESLREHYAVTLRRWVANLESQWDRAVALAGEGRARVWRLYMAGSAIGFEDGGVAVHQVLGVNPTPEGASGMPRTRADWE